MRWVEVSEPLMLAVHQELNLCTSHLFLPFLFILPPSLTAPSPESTRSRAKLVHLICFLGPAAFDIVLIDDKFFQHFGYFPIHRNKVLRDVSTVLSTTSSTL